MSSQEIENLPPTSSQEPQVSDDLPSTSWVLNNIDKEMRPKEAVACMNCPMAVWMLRGKSLEAYCRTLYLIVWETDKPGTITMCDAPEQARLAAEEEQTQPTMTPTESIKLLPAPAQNAFVGESFGLLDLGSSPTQSAGTGFL